MDDSQRQELVSFALQEAEKYKPSFVDARLFSTADEKIQLQNGSLDQVSTTFEQGLNIRVILGGAWGYASTAELSKQAISQRVQDAIAVAKASQQALRTPIELTEEPIIKDRYDTPYKTDPFSVEPTEKVELLKIAHSVLSEISDQIKLNQSYIHSHRVSMAFASSEGSEILQTQTYVGCGVSAYAFGTERQRRSSRDFKMKGFEKALEFDFERQARQMGEEVMLLVNEAVNCPKKKTPFILEPDMLGLTIHESTGHPTELDRVLEYEADFAGTSFLTTDKYRTGYKYGSPLVNLRFDPTLPYALGSYKYDDEGVVAKPFNIVEEGIFQNYMTDRETAKKFGLPHSNGNARIANYNRMPIVRMGNLHLMPDPNGPKGIDEMIAETTEGVMASTWKSHSIDDKRLNFQFSTEIGWLVEQGERTKPLKNLCYNASTPDFWAGCDMITQEFQSFGFGPICGKGVPMQAMWIEHGGGYGRFQDVQVFAS